uniref:Alpha-2-macroglobulin n=1 Tax=Canis lupus familiaris TaxID=9615 RepID=A0A8C0SZD3_CANLF
DNNPFLLHSALENSHKNDVFLTSPWLIQTPILHRQYLVLVPSQLYAKVPEKACVMLNDLNETVTVNLILEYAMQTRTLLSDVVTKNSFYCRPFTVSIIHWDMGLITVEVKGPTQLFIKKKKVRITKVDSLIFVQTDKPIYKPGQTVRFRVVSVDVSFHPLNETVSPITNPKRNRIFQWQNLRLQGGLSQLSFPLSVEPTLGAYKVKLEKESGEKIEYPFEVKEYVLPKFEVQVKMPKTISFLDEEFVVSACGLYTYGKPVSGVVTINICRKYSQYHFACHGMHSQGVCEEFSQQADDKGCFTQLVKTKVFQLRQRGYDMTIQVEAKIKEEGTEVELTGHGSCEITNILSKLKFTKADTYYRPGLPFYGQVKYLFNKIHILGEVPYTNEHGLVNIYIDTTNFTSSLFTVMVTYKQNVHCFDNWWLEELHNQAQHTVKHIFSPSKSYVHLELVAGTITCGQTQEIRAHYILNGQILKDEKELTFYYLVRMETTIALSNHLLIYAILPNGEIVADTEKLEIENCFANKLLLNQSLPASHTNLEVRAFPNSLCALRAVDQSVLLMKPETELSPQSVSLACQSMHTGEDQFRKLEVIAERTCVLLSVRHGVVANGLILFEKLGNSKKLMIKMRFTLGPLYCLSTVLPLARGSAGAVYPMVMRHSSPAVEVKETVRKYFPETWIWDLVPVDLSGRSELAVKVPDTITEWKASALCLSEMTGLGLSPTISLQVFQPFFLELTLPYSVVRGEAFTLKATVFNYLSHCIRVSVQLEASPDKSADLERKNKETPCICGNHQKTMFWAVTPKSLGKMNFTATVEALQSQELCGNEVPRVPELGQKDTVVKPLLVENISLILFPSLIYLCLLSLETDVPEKLSLKVPSDVVEGSARATYSVLGDILGSAMQNLQNLLRMPYGCGEQNMVLFVPNIYVLNYLNETRQLTETIKSKAINYLISGYQRQLNYKHSDGSYSTFGDHDGRSQGNTWLTAFVLKSFAQARSHIFVEMSHITSSLTWLSQRQKENGCFQRSGSLLNNAIKGGVDDELMLSAYITIALLEMPLPVTHPLVRNALFCLESAWGSISEAQGSLVYTKALLAYAFALAGNQVKRNELLKSLDKDAVKEEDSIHWQRPGKVEEVTTFYQPRAPSVEVEMTSYLLLAYLTASPAPSSEDLSVASRIVKWITKQQNANGGFSSTQDTVVALQALSKYGAATFSKREKTTVVTVKSSETFSQKFEVHDANRLLLQEVRLPEIPGEYSTTVSGSGCVYLQTSLRYNILPKKEGKVPFNLKVDTFPKNCDGVDTHRKFQIHINISYTGERSSSNMVIVDVKMVSGFIPVKSSVRKVNLKYLMDSKAMINADIYLTNQTLSFSFSVEQDIQVDNLKPATVKAYDYYETGESQYSPPVPSTSPAWFSTEVICFQWLHNCLYTFFPSLYL